MTEELLSDGAGTAVEVVAVMDGDRLYAVVPEQGQVHVELGQLVQVQAVNIEGVPEGVEGRPEPGMLDVSVVNPRPHNSIPKVRATATADFTASSWNPLPR